MPPAKKKPQTDKVAQTSEEKSDLQTNQPDVPIETTPEAPVESTETPTESPETPAENQTDAPVEQSEARQQRDATRNAVRTANENQVAEYERKQAELDAAREEHNRRSAHRFDVLTTP